MRKMVFFLVVISGAWISSGWFTYTNHERIQKIVNKVPPDTWENIQKGFTSATDATKAILTDEK